MMKKLLVLLMVLCLAVLPAFAETTVLDFDDFTWEIDNEMAGSVLEKAEGTPYIFLYPAYDAEALFHPGVNCVWTATVLDVNALTEQNIALLAQTVIDNTVAQYTALGYETKDASVLSAMVMKMTEWNTNVLMTTNTYAIDLAQNGEFLTLYTCQVYVGGAFGTYTFTVTADDFDTNMEACMSLLNTIAWVNE